MTKQEHINYWSFQVENDFKASEVLCLAAYYAQSLFWAHLSLENLLKALWLKIMLVIRHHLFIIY